MKLFIPSFLGVDDLWTTITAQATTANTALTAFLMVAILIPVTFYIFALVKKGLGRAK